MPYVDNSGIEIYVKHYTENNPFSENSSFCLAVKGTYWFPKYEYSWVYLNEEGLTYFDEWLAIASAIIEKQQGFISVQGSKDVEKGIGNIVLKFKDQTAFDGWVKKKIHDVIVHDCWLTVWLY